MGANPWLVAHDTKADCIKTLDTQNCPEVENCLTTVCYTNKTNVTTYACRMCSKGYYPDGKWDTINSTGSRLCKKGELIKNCEFYTNIASGNVPCYGCESGYSADKTGKTCISYAADVNCRNLNSASG